MGGGGLLSRMRARRPRPGTWPRGVSGSNPRPATTCQQSFRSGTIVHIDVPRTIADGAQTQHLGNYTFPIIRDKVDDILTASDDELVACMRFFATRMKMVIEPTGCLGLAAARNMGPLLQGKRVGIILSGGNVDLSRFCALTQ